MAQMGCEGQGCSLRAMVPEKLLPGNLGRIWQLLLGTGRTPGPAGWDGHGCVHPGYSMSMGRLCGVAGTPPSSLMPSGRVPWARWAEDV